MSSRRYDKEFERVRWRERRANTRDAGVPKTGKHKSARVELGLTLLSRIAVPGVCYTYDEIAAWAGCTETAVWNIERRALLKLRNRLRFMDPGLGRDLFTELFDRRQAAVSRNAGGIA